MPSPLLQPDPVRRTLLRPALLLACLPALPTIMAAQAAAQAASGDADICQAAIVAVERSTAVPPQLLSAIARVESGRMVASGRLVAWPWTLNVAGTGYFYGSAAEAITAIETARAAGIQSIDVGCMQINLQHHPAAFTSLQEALNPKANATYAARFLMQLHGETNSWPQAAATYHSRTPERAADYGRRVMRAWPLAVSYGGAAMLAGASAPRADALPTVDPYGVYTTEFARRLSMDAAARAARNGGLQAETKTALRHRGNTLAQRFPSQLRVAAARGSIRVAQSETPRTGPAMRRP